MGTHILTRAAITLAALAMASPAPAAPLWGIGKAIDGDSLTVDGKEVRLHGIDAPEFNQTCKKGGQDWALACAGMTRRGR